MLRALRGADGALAKRGQREKPDLWAELKAKHVQVRIVFELSKKGLDSRFSG
jgi:hypothetical protein